MESFVRVCTRRDWTLINCQWEEIEKRISPGKGSTINGNRERRVLVEFDEGLQLRSLGSGVGGSEEETKSNGAGAYSRELGLAVGWGGLRVVVMDRDHGLGGGGWVDGRVDGRRDGGLGGWRGRGGRRGSTRVNEAAAEKEEEEEGRKGRGGRAVETGAVRWRRWGLRYSCVSGGIPRFGRCQGGF